MDIIIDLINRLRENNIDLFLSGSDLEINFDGEVLPDTILNEIRHNKTHLIDFLRKTTEGREMNIRVAPQQADYPVSSSQKRMWLLSHLDENNQAYCLPEVHAFEGALNPRALTYAFHALVARHEILRTVFRENEAGEIRQVILGADAPGWGLRYEDLSDMAEQEQGLNEKIHHVLRSPFDLATGPLLRAGLFRVAADKWVLAYVMHHIISDGWSMQILVKELLWLYNAWLSGKSDPLLPLSIQYKDYAVWQQEQLTGPAVSAHKQYWLERFKGELPVLDLLPDMPRKALKSNRGAVTVTRMNDKLSDAFRQLCRQTGCTVFMGMLAAVNALFYRYTGQEDIILGTPAAGRDHTDLEDQIGFYINTLALRTRFRGSDSFPELLTTVKQVTLGAYEHQLYPFDELVSELQLSRDMSRNPLFDVMVVMQNARGFSKEKQTPMQGMKITRYGRENETVSKFDLTFDFVETGSEILIETEYCSDLFNAATVERMVRHLVQLLEAAVGAPSMPIRELDYLTAEERRQLLVQFNDTAFAYQEGKTLIHLFEEQVILSPQRTAIVAGEISISFEALNITANRFAHYLRQQYAVQPDDLIAVKLERGSWMITSLLAVLKSGAAYVPIDPEYPQDRIDYMLKDGGCKALIDEHTIADFCTDTTQWSDGNPQQINTSGDLAYVIYTSGSTGRPKGCMLEHEGVVNRITWMWQHYQFTTEDIILQKTNFTFDVSVWEIFLPLCFGAKMVICQKEIAAAPEQLLSLINEQQVTCMHFVPGMLQDFIVALFAEPNIADRLSSLRAVFASGEALTAETVRQWYQRMDTPLHNLYGPTEASVDVTYYTTSANDLTIPIGQPIWNTQIYILDAAGKPVPLGIAGQICIGGTCLARGYLHQPELTNSKFIANPFREGERIYLTGDLGKWLPDGHVQYLGRMDAQVKIRGLRIELGEIESLLKQYEELDTAVVITRPDHQGELCLVAYLVSASEPDINGIRAYLRQYLPAYMLPQYYVRLSRLPVNASGKTDLKKLPDPENFAIASGALYVAPRNSTEEQLVRIWQELLGKQQVGVKDNFFNLGGHSLKVTRLASRIYKTFQVKPGLKTLLDKIILEDQAAYIINARKAAFVAIAPAAQQTDYPVSSAQQRLWLSCQFDTANVAYNIPCVYLLEGELDKAALEQSFLMLLERHESLRTAFRKNEEGEIRQWILSPEKTIFTVNYIDASEDNDPGKKAEALVEEACRGHFDLSQAPLLSALLVKVAAKKWVLNFVIHHIVSDGWSMNILFRELMVFYNAIHNGKPSPLEPLPIHYKDYTVWLQQQLGGEGVHLNRNYWLQQLSGELPVIELPGDRMRPPVKTFHGGVVSETINATLTTALKTLTEQQGSTLFMGLLSALYTLLYRYTYQQDIIIGCPIAGREHIDLEEQVGLYLNTLALRAQFSGTDNCLELLEKVRQLTTAAYDHQAYPFDVLLDELAIPRDMSRNPLFDVAVEWSMNSTPNTDREEKPEGLEIYEYRSGKIAYCKFDLYFKFIEQGPETGLMLHYNSDIYTAVTATQMATHFVSLLSAMLEDPRLAIRDLAYLSASEEHTLLHDFNASAKSYPTDKTVIGLFEEQVQRTPDNIALVFENQQLDYKTFNEKVNRLANYLVEHYQIGADTLVGILVNPSLEMIIAVFAVLKSGGAYLPVDPELPDARIDFILKDTNISVLLTVSSFLPGPGSYEGAVINLDHPLENLDTSTQSPVVNISLQDLAYVIYTSGSTGLPKGVMISHGSLVDYFYGIMDKTNLRDCRTFAMTSTLAADLGNTVIYTSLLIGGTMRLFPRSALMEPELLFKDGLDLLKIVPSHWKALQTAGKTYLPDKCMIMGGEPLTTDIVAAIRNSGRQCRVFNHYGPTEVTIAKVVNDVDLNAETQVALGRPFCRSAVYVLDDQLRLMPVGAIGEICISGTGLSKGYINRPEMTAQKFIPNPFQENERIYKTGDLGRWLPDGTLEFQGRKDDQVKVRGYRIELGEIENALRNHPDIEASFVRIRTSKNGEKELVAYIVSNSPLPAAELRQHLSLTLPDYMVPAYFVALQQLPLTPNGKVDRKMLPEPEDADLLEGTTYVAPSNEREQQLVAIWEAVLGRSNIGVKDDYFLLGGNSLKVISIIRKITVATGVTVPVKTFFLERTIAGIAAWIMKATPAEQEISPVADANTHVYEASYNQLTFLTGWKLGNPLVITPYEYEQLDTVAFSTAVHQLAARHEILRTRFTSINGVICQDIQPAASFRIDISGPVEMATDAAMEAVISNAHRRILDPLLSPLVLIEIYRKPSGNFLVLLTMHHALTDGHSDGIIQRELAALYTAAIRKETAYLEPLPLQYKDFSAWQRNFLNTPQGRQQQAYWLQKLAGFVPALVPVATEMPDSKDQKSICISNIIGGDEYAGMETFAATNGMTRAALIMGTLAVLTGRLTRAEDLSLLVTVSGRNSSHFGQMDVSGLIGYFANALIVRTHMPPTSSLLAYWQEVQNGFLDDLAHDVYPVEKLIRELPGITPLTFMNEAVFYNYHNYAHLNTHDHHNTAHNGVEVSYKEALQMPFGIAVKEFRNCLKLEMMFDHRRFSLQQAKAMQAQFMSVLHQLLSDPHQQVVSLLVQA